MVQPAPPSSRAELVVGAELGERFVVEALLGRGGMGAVYCVLDRALGERVALKTMNRDLADTAAIERFRREVKLARRITHRNVARTFDLGEENGVFYLTMELLSGPSLKQLVRSEGKLPMERAADIVAQLCDGLRAAHEAGVVHRDLKPHNVVLEPDGRVVILDFGIAYCNQSPTITAGVVGTPAYMAPEQIGGGEPDARSDLYGVGLILHELVSGELPSWQGSKRDVISRLSGAPPELSLAGAAAPLAGIVQRLLAPNPKDRPTCAAEVAAALRGTGGEPEPTRHELPTESRQFAPMPIAGQTLAVIPFAERGALEGLGAELAEELVDALSRVQGLRVLASRATARFGSDADPEQVGRELRADLAVSGTAQRRGDSVRVTVRLIDTSDGVQIWTERFEDAADRLLDFVDQTAQRIAEALRLEISLAAERGDAGAEAVELYLEGSRRRRRYELGAFEVLDHAVELAPRFRPALASRALAAARRALIGAHAPGDAFVDTAERAIAAALSAAPEYPESQLAAAVLASQRADYSTAVMLLRRAVTIAPTFAEAQEYLGLLQLEAGRTKEGLERLELAAALDPLGPLGVSLLWRHYAMTGNVEKRDAMFRELTRRAADSEPVVFSARLRAAVWARDAAQLAELTSLVGAVKDSSVRCLVAVARVAAGRGGLDDEDAIEALPDTFTQPRFATLMHQYAAEAWAVVGREERALHHVTRATDLALLDFEWLLHCPALASLRADRRFKDAMRRVRERAQALWTV